MLILKSAKAQNGTDKAVVKVRLIYSLNVLAHFWV
jgi:hypothetical protein